MDWPFFIRTEFEDIDLDPVSLLSQSSPLQAKPYSASFINISAMSFGVWVNPALQALNKALIGVGFYHYTGEGGVSPYHLNMQRMFVWQNRNRLLWGCRNDAGGFDADKFTQQAATINIKWLEIKLSQGAKTWPWRTYRQAKKHSEIADYRGCQSRHTSWTHHPRTSAFSSPIELIKFVRKLRGTFSGAGKPVG